MQEDLLKSINVVSKLTDELNKKELLNGIGISQKEDVKKPTKRKPKSFLDDEPFEMRISKIAKRYLKNSFFIDFMACVPVLLYEATYGFSTEFDTVTTMINSGWY